LIRILVGAIGLAIYGVGAVVALFSPVPVSDDYPRIVDTLLDFFYRIGGPLGFGVVEVEMLLNVLVFIPIGVFGAMLLPRGLWWIAVLAGAALSIAAELFQSAVLTSRVGSLRDVLLNILGTAIGSFATWLVRKLASRRAVDGVRTSG
jgi:glycopeptide antibiotics resistance protein